MQTITNSVGISIAVVIRISAPRMLSDAYVERGPRLRRLCINDIHVFKLPNRMQQTIVIRSPLQKKPTPKRRQRLPLNKAQPPSPSSYQPTQFLKQISDPDHNLCSVYTDTPATPAACGISLSQRYPFGGSAGAPRQCLGVPDLFEQEKKKDGFWKSYRIILGPIARFLATIASQHA